MSGKIRWGILGTAKVARTSMIPAIRQSGNGVVQAIGSRDLKKAQTVAEQLAIPRACGSYEAVLADPQVDAVYIPLPVALHAEWSIKCAEAGKPALCEKPLAPTAAEARRMAEAFQRRGLPLAEAIMYHFHPLTRRVRDMVQGGAVGRVHSIRTSFNVTLEDQDIRFHKELGGGALLDLGCYCVSFTRLIAGEEPSQVRSLIHRHARGVDETTTGLLGFPSGVQGYLGCSVKTQFDCSYEISGSAGRILVDRGALVAWPGEDFKIKHWAGDQYEEITIPQANHYQLLVEDFSDALLNQRPPAIPLEESIRNLETLDRIRAEWK